MPIVIITGLPASGKSTRARQLHDYLAGKGKRVHIISENEAVPKALYEKNAFFNSSQSEKVVRSDLKSEASRHLNKDDVVILDAGNYIKGFRYELHCMTKAVRTTQCTLFTCIPLEQAWTFNIERNEPDKLDEQADQSDRRPNNSNVPYTREIFDALCMRYEEPQSSSRWDSPLVVALPEDAIDLEAIYKSLYETQPLPPNQSTQNPPLGATNYLFELDIIMQEIIKEILGAVKIGAFGQLRVRGSTVKVKVTTSMNAMQLNRLRQKFITSTCRASQTTPAPLAQVPQLFVQFINANTVGC
ncbi:protein KTI12 homolog [Drosophila grimshawi]|uniref:Protein KTI12 homolog n=1 Tax=Drosophila grimshawi TaxID=7222 RepID=B4JX71_DROGR|nr:protein KTI12 homolog [Drosophila grimshawi]EDV95347.1 GH17893 [Drosophila grimshawi]